MGQSGGGGGRLADEGGVALSAGVTGTGVPGVVAGLLLVLHHTAVRGVDVVLVLGAAAAKVQLVHHDALGPTKLGAQPLHVAGGDAGVVAGGLQGGVLADVGLIAGGAGLGHPGGSQVAGGGDEGDLAHGQGGQGLKGEGAVLSDDLLDEAGLSGGDVVLLGQLGQVVVHGDGLGEDGPGLEGAGDGGGELVLELGGGVGVSVLHRYQNGVLQLVQIPLLEAGADDGVDGSLQIGALQLHAAHDVLGVIVERGGGGDSLLVVDGQGDAGVDVQGHHRVGGTCLLETGDAKDTAGHNGQGGCGGEGGDPAALIRIVFHRDHSSFLFLAGGKDGIQLIGGSVGGRLLNSLVNFLVGHLSLPPSMRR